MRLLKRDTVYKRMEERCKLYNGDLTKVFEDEKNKELVSQYIHWHLLNAYCDKNRSEMLEYVKLADKYVGMDWCEKNFLYLLDLLQDSKYELGLSDKPSKFYPLIHNIEENNEEG